ncbi:malto-oligosyltrehalose trehalohydrolase [Pseudomonas sp. UL073]|uniref:Malto-oligosyltrehalose trehalohydrolase n=1 Tax=Zestomonas insulae TaxID=2809017 RepID=A0ABS2IHT3_9GAMM|nr:malto-oligosyltrehalose trehalohydrolase [Pseudomonas insulae]MBM7061889.1 malto-oligosyltrehalose trehalohydrolase [Pseudomonas insulae]
MTPPSTRSHGALLQEDGTTRFALWAPDAAEVAVVFDDGARHALRGTADGWFQATLNCAVGLPYRYLIDGQLEVPDPASRAQAGDVHGASLVVDPQAYAWRHPEWRGRPWHETVLYEVHVGLLGGFAEVEARLPAWAELGITAIELMPLGEFPGTRNWGYDGVLPFAPESSYGPPEALKSLIDSAHGLGLMVFIDVVYNHFGPDGNYLGHYARAFFREDRHTPWGPAVDFRRREVRDFFCENALMWLRDYRVDGLRLDAVHAIGERGFLVELAQRARAAALPGRHVHLVLENEDNDARLLEQGYDAQWNDDAHNALHVLLTGETEGYYADFAERPIDQLARCLAEGFAFQGEIDRRGHCRGRPSTHLPPSSFVLFLQNHDQIGNRALGERLTQLSHPRALRAATLLLLLAPMVPLLFMGDEYGARQPFLYFTEHHDDLAEAVRDGRRAEFAEFAQFQHAEQRAAIPDPNAPATFEASRPSAEGPSGELWLGYYRQLLRLRHDWIVPRLLGCQALGVEVLSAQALSASWRLGDGCRLRIDLNLGALAVDRPPQRREAQPLFASAEVSIAMLPPLSAAATLEEPS